jgi:hypothetical protein
MHSKMFIREIKLGITRRGPSRLDAVSSGRPVSPVRRVKHIPLCRANTARWRCYFTASLGRSEEMIATRARLQA